MNRSGRRRAMGLTNFILTVTGVSAVLLLLRSDVKQSAAIFRRNVKHVRNWLKDESGPASRVLCVILTSGFWFASWLLRRPHDSVTFLSPRKAEKVTKGIEEKVSKKNVSGEQKS